MWLRTLLSFWLVSTPSYAFACAMPVKQFSPTIGQFDQIIIGTVSQVRPTKWLLEATMTIAATALGTRKSGVTKLRWPKLEPLCGAPSPLLRQGDEVAIYLDHKFKTETIAGWLLLSTAVEADPRLMRAAPEFVRKNRVLLIKQYGGGPIPRGNPKSWITTDDYPTGALHGGLHGLVSIQATVDDRGRTTGCNVIRSSSSSLLDNLTCKIFLRRARYRPPIIPEERLAKFKYRWVAPAIGTRTH